MIRWYAPYFNAYTFVLARANEYEADAASAELVGAQHAAHALMRADIVDARHRRFMEQACDRIAHDATPPDVMQGWADEARRAPVDVDARGWLREALDHGGHFLDTHPTLRARLTALQGVAKTSTSRHRRWPARRRRKPGSARWRRRSANASSASGTGASKARGSRATRTRASSANASPNCARCPRPTSTPTSSSRN